MAAVILKNLREERTKLVKDSRDLLERAEGEKRAFNQEEENTWEEMNDKITNLGNRITRYVELEKLEKESAEAEDHGLGNRGSHIEPEKKVGGDQPNMTRDDAFNVMLNAWCRAEKDVRQKRSFTNRLKQAQKVYGQRFDISNRRVRIQLQRDYTNLRRQILRNATMTVGTPGNGGYTIPQGFVNSLEAALLWFGPMLQVADVIRTATGNPLPWPTTNDTGNTGVLLTEETTVGTSVVATFAQKTFNAYKMSSKLVQISEELINDSAFDLANEVGSQCGMRLGRVANTYLTTGTGTNQPEGIVTGATLGKTAASAIAITFDEIIDLEHSVDIAYRQRMGYMCLDSTINALRKLKDGQSRYLWQQFANSGQPDTLNNRPLHTNQDMAAIATGNKTILAGDFSKFKVRMVGEIRARRLSERYADTDQEAFISFMRIDSKVLDAGTHPIKYLQQA